MTTQKATIGTPASNGCAFVLEFLFLKCSRVSFTILPNWRLLMTRQHFIPFLLTFLLLASFPNPCLAAEKVVLFSGENVLAGANHNSNLGSSDMTLIMKLEGDGETFVDEGHEVKYIIPDKDIKDWFKPEFKDSKWEDGISGVGYGDTDDNTVTRGSIWSVYTRYRFKVKDAFRVKKLMFFVDYDDGYVAWLNGVEIWRSGGMAGKGDPPKWNVGSGGHGSSEQPKGKPNKNRWGHPKIESIEVQFTAKRGQAVEPIDKLATMWGKMKAIY